MKTAFIALVLLPFVFACKQKEESKAIENEGSPAEKIAQANGIDHWYKVSELQFTFNVDRDTTHFERSWTWHPKTDDVIMISGKDTVAYNRKSVDSTSMDADKAFINDKYWLLAPFQMVWDTSATLSEASMAEAPISKDQLNKITLTYSNEGGYTPGDAYDFYYNDDYKVKEWNYRKGNADAPTLSATWENYENHKGLNIATAHNRSDANWKLYFTNIKVSQ